MQAVQEAARARAAAQRAAEHYARAAERASAAEEREARRLHGEARAGEAAARNAEVASRRRSLETILDVGLRVDPYIDLDSLKQSPVIPAFDPGELRRSVPQPKSSDYMPPPQSMALRMIPGMKRRHEQRVEERRHQLERDLETWRSAAADRLSRLNAALDAHQPRVREAQAQAQAQHAEVDAFKAGLESGTSEAVRYYLDMVLTRSSWPNGFPQKYVLAYDPGSRLVVVDYTLPDWSIVPEDKAYRYVKAHDVIEPISETVAQRRSLYASVVAQSALRILYEIFRSDHTGVLETVALNCLVATTNRSTGAPVVPCILSVRTTASTFNAINLRAVDPAACLKGLAAAVSPSPSELAPVRPVLELKMVDPRFVTESDVLSQLDHRPNLMELSPLEFESLITNLFGRMGLETRLTQASRDGGVDCVGFDPRPIFGGKVVIQAKRYKNTVGVSAVRDLFGTMQNEGASKGILVTTSGYGSASFKFAEGKPIELLSGANLLYLLAEYANIEARIVVPEGWRDPTPDEPWEPPAAATSLSQPARTRGQHP
jgi:restriction system protein